MTIRIVRKGFASVVIGQAETLPWIATTGERLARRLLQSHSTSDGACLQGAHNSCAHECKLKLTARLGNTGRRAARLWVIEL